MSDLISILIPTRNADKYIADCLDSIVNQTEQSWELLVVNDHSEDETENILKQYQNLDNRIKYFNNTGRGIIEALRLAYSNSKGNLITRMDSDDLMEATKLEKMKSALLSKGDDFLATAFVKYFADKPLGDGYIKYQNWLNELAEKENNFTEIYKECVIASPCWMIRKSTFEKCEAFRPNTYPEDYDLCFRFYENGLKIVSVKEVMHYWRDYATRASRTDEHYADNRFLQLKINYFCKLDKDKKRPLVLWGAGKKGKFLAQLLIDKKKNFIWVCNNEKKIGKSIYDVKLFGIEHLENIEKPQIIIAVAAKDALQEINQYLTKENSQNSKDHFYFCQ